MLQRGNWVTFSKVARMHILRLASEAQVSAAPGETGNGRRRRETSCPHTGCITGMKIAVRLCAGTALLT